MNEHRLYIVLGLLFLTLGALFVQRADSVGAAVFLLAGTGIIVNGARALRREKSAPTRTDEKRFPARVWALLAAIVLAIVVIFLQERR